MTENYEKGRCTYATYCQACKGKNNLGMDLLPWDVLSLPDQQLWINFAMLMTGSPIPEHLGELAYNAYCEHTNWLSFRGEPLPRWPEVRENIREGWGKAAMAVFNGSTEGPGEEDGPWAKGWAQRSGLSEVPLKVTPVASFDVTVPMAPVMHPYHCVQCGTQLHEAGLGVLGCSKCSAQYIATRSADQAELSLSWPTPEHHGLPDSACPVCAHDCYGSTPNRGCPECGWKETTKEKP